jgi:hypothetical protein
MRGVRLGTLGVLIILLTAAFPRGALASPPRWGIDAYSVAPSFLDKAELAMRRSFSSFAVYSTLGSSSSFPKMDYAAHAISVHALIYLNINSYRIIDGKKSAICWRSVADGLRDADIRAWISRLKAVDYHRIIVTFNHEPTVFQSPNQPKCQSDNASSYKSAFDHVYHMFRRAGLDYRFAFVTTASQFRTGGARAFMPMGDFQVVGADGYNRFRNRFRTPGHIFSPVHRWAVNHRMPLLIGEIGCVSTAKTATWVTSAAALLKSYGDVVAVNWNNSHKYRLDQRTDSWLAFLAASKTYL